MNIHTTAVIVQDWPDCRKATPYHTEAGHWLDSVLLEKGVSVLTDWHVWGRRYVLDRVLRLDVNGPALRRNKGLCVIRRSITFCFNAERTFKILGSDAANEEHRENCSCGWFANEIYSLVKNLPTVQYLRYRYTPMDNHRENQEPTAHTTTIS